MGATSSNTKRYQDKFNSNIYSTPPKVTNGGVSKYPFQFQYDPRSPTDGISRTPIQLESQLPIPSLKLYNHVIPRIVGPDIIITEVNDDDDVNNNNQENEVYYREQKLHITEQVVKRSSGIEPTLDPSKVLTALVANDNGDLPPYQL